MEFKCSCHGSGINCFTGKCDRCGLTKESTIEKMQIPTLINNLKLSILHLPKYNSTYGSGGLDCWGEMEEDKDGEYIKLEDVLNLFSAKK